MGTSDRAYLWCPTCEKEGSEITCPDCNKPMLIVPSKKDFLKAMKHPAEGLFKQIESRPYEKKDFTLEEFRAALLDFYQKSDAVYEMTSDDHEQEKFEREMMAKSNKELEELPEGLYNIGSGGLKAQTGKRGFINYIKEKRKIL